MDDEGFVTETIASRPQKSASEGPNDSQIGEKIYDPPDFKKAQDFYDKTLPRRVELPRLPSDNKQRYRLALPGEIRSPDTNQPSVPYNFFDSAEVLDEFGLGIGVYFQSLKAVGLIITICAFISLASIYQNLKFSPTHLYITEYKNSHPSVANQTPVTCPSYLLGSTYGAQRESFVLSKQGAADLSCCAILAIFAVLSYFLEAAEVKEIDDETISSRDYTIEIKNPPIDITDPMTYYEFFKKYGDICFVTVLKNNGQLCSEISHKKLMEAQLAALQAMGYDTPQSALAYWKKLMQQYMGSFLTCEFLEQQIAESSQRIELLARRDYKPCRVYVTFNAQKDMRMCLARTGTSSYEIWRNQSANEETVFNGKVLLVRGAPEPSDICYENTHVGFYSRLLSWAISYLICCGVVVASFFIVRSITSSKQNGSTGVAIFISILNAVIPEFVKYVTLTIERHQKNSAIQNSVLVKLVVVRCINSGVLIYLAAPWSEQFSAKHIEAIFSILLADAITTPIFRFFDLYGLFQRHVLGRFAATQHELNNLWAGNDWTLAERYTDTLKTLFVGIFFAVPLPSGLFITAFAMASTYFVDKYSLFRIWKRAPSLDASMSEVARYFFAATLWTHLNVSRMYFANWPYEDIWGTKAQYAKCGFFFCSLNNHMTNDQKIIVQIYNVLCIAVFILVVGTILMVEFREFIVDLFIKRDANEGSGADTTSFWDARGSTAYVPVIDPGGAAKPILFVDLRNVPSSYFSYFPVHQDLLLEESSTKFQNLSAVHPQEFTFLSASDVDPYLKSIFSEFRYFQKTSSSDSSSAREKNQAAAAVAYGRPPTQQQQKTAPGGGMPTSLGVQPAGAGATHAYSQVPTTPAIRAPAPVQSAYYSSQPTAMPGPVTAGRQPYPYPTGSTAASNPYPQTAYQHQPTQPQAYGASPLPQPRAPYGASPVQTGPQVGQVVYVQQQQQPVPMGGSYAQPRVPTSQPFMRTF